MYIDKHLSNFIVHTVSQLPWNEAYDVEVFLASEFWFTGSPPHVCTACNEKLDGGEMLVVKIYIVLSLDGTFVTQTKII